MPKETMTPLERWLAVLRRQKPDRVPMDYWATKEATQKVMKHLGCSRVEEVYERLHIDRPVEVIQVGIKEKRQHELQGYLDHAVFPTYVGPPLQPGTDVFGCVYQAVDYNTGIYSEAVHHPLARFNTVEEIKHNYKWPSPDWWDYSNIAAALKGKEHLPVIAGGSEPFLIYNRLRGDELGIADLVINPEMVHYCLDILFELAYQNTIRIYEQIPGRVTISYVDEDFGSQEGLMYSPAHIHEFLLPRMKRMIDLVHQAGAFVFHHSDGAIRKILPDMIEAGIDILNPVQWRCNGMEREGLKRDFGDRVIFHGGVDNQYTLPFGTVEEVRQEVLDNIRILGSGGGYILAPCHNIQGVSPPENVVTMYETGYENFWT